MDIIKMNPEWKQKWLEALRSDTYQQGKHQLRTIKDQYCCLGVLCDIYKKDWREKDGAYVWGDEQDEFTISSSLAKTLSITMDGMDGKDPVIPLSQDLKEKLVKIKIHSFKAVNYYDDCVSLAALNDAGFTFNEIADLIEQYL